MPWTGAPLALAGGRPFIGDILQQIVAVGQAEFFAQAQCGGCGPGFERALDLVEVFQHLVGRQVAEGGFVAARSKMSDALSLAGVDQIEMVCGVVDGIQRGLVQPVVQPVIHHLDLLRSETADTQRRK